MMLTATCPKFATSLAACHRSPVSGTSELRRPPLHEYLNVSETTAHSHPIPFYSHPRNPNLHVAGRFHRGSVGDRRPHLPSGDHRYDHRLFTPRREIAPSLCPRLSLLVDVYPLPYILLLHHKRRCPVYSRVPHHCYDPRRGELCS